jgi:RNA polymerase sigma factor (sigma-70 family)
MDDRNMKATTFIVFIILSSIILSKFARSIRPGATLVGGEGQRMDHQDAPRNRSLEEFRSYLLLLARLQRLLAAPSSQGESPSGRAVRNEDLLRLADALTRLPEAQREAIVLHHLQGCSLAKTAHTMGKTDAAVAGLLHRGLKKLRQIMTAGE